MTHSLNILIVEDSPSFSLELEMLIEKLGYNVLKSIDNAEDALNIIRKDIPDLILMDIDLKGKMTGIELSEEIIHLDIPIIFITSYDDEKTYDSAKKSKMLAYLIKPISSFSLKIAIETAIKNAFDDTSNEQQDNFFAKNCLFLFEKGIYHKVHVSRICYIQSSDNYCEFIISNSKRFVVRLSLSSLIKDVLPKDKFIRIHRQFIIHLNHIDAIDFNENVVHVSSQKLPISRTYKKELQNTIYKVN